MLHTDTIFIIVFSKNGINEQVSTEIQLAAEAPDKCFAVLVITQGHAQLANLRDAADSAPIARLAVDRLVECDGMN
ncbi:hypothetical protein [Pseudomonas sp. PLMAX]|uniref:hypothetical protein n=1 Tax=Pseudomonas sp. PLMAX TaxID=2201998 RepID=UPI0038BBDFD8